MNWTLTLTTLILSKNVGGQIVPLWEKFHRVNRWTILRFRIVSWQFRSKYVWTFLKTMKYLVKDKHFTVQSKCLSLLAMAKECQEITRLTRYYHQKRWTLELQDKQASFWNTLKPTWDRKRRNTSFTQSSDLFSRCMIHNFVSDFYWL